VPKPCSITAEQQRRANAMAKAALERAHASGSVAKLRQIEQHAAAAVQAHRKERS
jgi:hypothetical protein